MEVCTTTFTLRMMHYSVSDTGMLGKKIRVLLLEVELSYRRLMGAKAIKLGSWDKHPAYC